MISTEPLWGLPDPDTAPDFYADVPIKRLLAWIVDSILIVVISLVMVPLTAFTGLLFFAALYLMVALAYRVMTLARYSATPGMMLTAIELRRADGTLFDLPTAILHTLLYVFFTTVFLLQAISIILMLASARGQGLHDMLLGTAALNKSRSF